MDRALRGRGRGRVARPLLEAALIAEPIDPARRSRLCAGSAILASRSPPRSAFRRRPSAASLRRFGLNRLSALEPAQPVRRYERAVPGEIIHIDVQKLGKFNRIGHCITGDRNGQSNTRGIEWEYVHLAIDDPSRVAYSEILPDERRASCLRFLFNALRFFRSLDVKVCRVMTDNGSSFRSRRYAKALRGLEERSRKPSTPPAPNCLVHLATVFGVVLNRRAASTLGSRYSIPARTIISRPLGVKGAFSCVSIRSSANHRRLATSAFTVQTEWTTS